MKKVVLVLGGAGQFDGSETHEVILTLLSLAQAGVEFDAVAPNIDQAQVYNHYTNETVEGETRNALVEAARLVRGQIKPITEVNVADYDGVIVPGGMGAASILCDYAEKGPDLTLQADVKKFLDDAIKEKLPMGFMCVSPVMLPKLFDNVTLTLGTKNSPYPFIEHIESMGAGAQHIECEATDIAVDEKHKIVTTPANVNAKDIAEVYQGIHKMVNKLVEWL
jgi:enhancing lycopene biosynthesis protein 2